MLDYNLYGIGVRTVYLYDNTERFELRQWAEERRYGYPRLRGTTTATVTTTKNREDGQQRDDDEDDERDRRVHVFHMTGNRKQSDGYQACAERAAADGHDWVFFTDIDEYLALKRHDHVSDFVQEYGNERTAIQTKDGSQGFLVGAISVNWRCFGDAGCLMYESYPLSKRFQYLLPSDYMKNKYVKSIVRLEGMNFSERVHDPHIFPLNHGYPQIDTNRVRFGQSIR